MQRRDHEKTIMDDGYYWSLAVQISHKKYFEFGQRSESARQLHTHLILTINIDILIQPRKLQIYLDMEGEAIVEKKTSEQPDKKKDHKKREKKVIKHERPAEYDRNPELITPETQLQPLPKKHEELPKPNIDDYKNKQKNLRDKITKFIEKKKQIRSEKFKPSKPILKGEGDKFDDFRAEVDQFNTLKQHMIEVKTERNLKRDQLTKLIQEAKGNNQRIRELKDSVKNSKQNIEQKIERLENRLLTAELSKNQEKELNAEILTLQRNVKNAQSAQSIEVPLAKAEQRKEQLSQQIDGLKAEMDPIEEQYKELKADMDKKNKAISDIKGQISNDTIAKNENKEKNNKEYEDWKQNKKKRLDEIQEKIKGVDADIKKIWEDYHKAMDKYWEQKHKLDFLKWQHNVRKRKIEYKEREKRRQLAIQREKQREKQEQKQKYIKEIQLCNLLINYLKDLTKAEEQNVKEAEANKPEPTQEEISAKIAEDSQWKKQKGLQIIVSKKNKEDEEPVKKGKKNKKKKQPKQQEKKQPKFEIPYQIESLFENLKLLPPTSQEEVSKKIEQLRERENLFQRACMEEANEEDKKMIEDIKSLNQKKKPKKVQQEKTEEFPTL